MGKPSIIAYVVAAALIVAGLIYGVSTRGSAGDEKPAVASTPSAKAVEHMSTDGVIENIERRLTQHQGKAMRATCPTRVAMTVGTTFTCQVFFTGRKDPIGEAAVKIDGPRGQFTWTSAPIASATPAG